MRNWIAIAVFALGVALLMELFIYTPRASSAVAPYVSGTTR